MVAMSFGRVVLVNKFKMCFKDHNKISFLKLQVHLWWFYCDEVLQIILTLKIIWKQANKQTKTPNTSFGVKETPACEHIAGP